MIPPMPTRERLKKAFADFEYRQAYQDEHCVTVIATQIYQMRLARGWTQAQLAKRAGVDGKRIRQVEEVDYRAWTLPLLRKLCRAFDTGLIVRLVSFDRVLDDLETWAGELTPEPWEAPKVKRRRGVRSHCAPPR